MIRVPDVIVSCDWLHEHLDEENLIILDATIPKVTAQKQESIDQSTVILGARFMDIKKDFSDSLAQFPNTMLSPSDFEKQAQDLGINQNSCIIIYDTHGVYSSPRAWYMFRSMGHENVAVLNGGLPEWGTLGYPVISDYEVNFSTGDFRSKMRESSFVNWKNVKEIISQGHRDILDARSLGRFEGTASEPREGVRSGHIPTSKSLPYSKLINQNKIKSKEELQSLFENSDKNNNSYVFSCGTGITACVLALGAEIAGYTDISVYDGSWTEWGSLLDLPVEL